MAHPWHHALRSAKLFGGQPSDYLPVHDWFDETKAHMPDLRHRALCHHAEGIFLCERMLGTVIRNSDGKDVPTRLIGEQHVKDDLGWIPTAKDWLVNLPIKPWMGRAPFRPMRDGISGGRDIPQEVLLYAAENFEPPAISDEVPDEMPFVPQKE